MNKLNLKTMTQSQLVETVNELIFHTSLLIERVEELEEQNVMLETRLGTLESEEN